jgi:hypothetical protein
LVRPALEIHQQRRAALIDDYQHRSRRQPAESRAGTSRAVLNFAERFGRRSTRSPTILKVVASATEWRRSSGANTFVRRQSADRDLLLGYATLARIARLTQKRADRARTITSDLSAGSGETGVQARKKR